MSGTDRSREGGPGHTGVGSGGVSHLRGGLHRVNPGHDVLGCYPEEQEGWVQSAQEGVVGVDPETQRTYGVSQGVDKGPRTPSEVSDGYGSFPPVSGAPGGLGGICGRTSLSTLVVHHPPVPLGLLSGCSFGRSPRFTVEPLSSVPRRHQTSKYSPKPSGTCLSPRPSYPPRRLPEPLIPFQIPTHSPKSQVSF